MHLFLDGPVKTGKSTLIRECIGPYINNVGGFSSQRLWHNNQACGYRLTPADQLQLDADFDENLPGIFTGHINQRSFKNPYTFERLGVELLEHGTHKSLILLDEIGGSELLVPAFREKLYEILAGPVPCIGVIKLAEKARYMSRTAGYSVDVVDYNIQLRQALDEVFHSRILHFTPDNRNDFKSEIELFLGSIDGLDK